MYIYSQKFHLNSKWIKTDLYQKFFQIQSQKTDHLGRLNISIVSTTLLYDGIIHPVTVLAYRTEKCSILFTKVSGNFKKVTNKRDNLPLFQARVGGAMGPNELLNDFDPFSNRGQFIHYNFQTRNPISQQYAKITKKNLIYFPFPPLIITRHNGCAMQTTAERHSPFTK